MKRLTKALILVLTVLIALSFVACSNPSSSDETSEWVAVKDKSDLIGTWKAEYYGNGAHEVHTIYVGSNYSGYIKLEVDYSGASAEFKSYIPDIIYNLECSGYTCKDDATNKTLKANLDFDSDDLDYIMSSLKINSSKSKIQISDGKDTSVYEKQ